MSENKSYFSTSCGSGTDLPDVQEEAIRKAKISMDDHPCGCEVCYAHSLIYWMGVLRERAPRYCKFCNTLLFRKENEDKRSFYKRQFCSNGCANRYARATRNQEPYALPAGTKDVYNAEAPRTFGERGQRR